MMSHKKFTVVAGRERRKRVEIMEYRELWQSVQGVTRAQAAAGIWAGFFLSMFDGQGRLNPFGEALMDALQQHCSAMNRLNTEACDRYKEIVNSRVSELTSDLEGAQRLLKASAGLNIAQTLPTGIAAFNFSNPVGWVAGIIGLGATVSAETCKSAGENAMTSLADKIRNTPRFIEEQASDNAVAQTAASMATVLELVKRKIGVDMLNSAYMMLMGTLSRHDTASNPVHFDDQAVGGALGMLHEVTNAPEFPNLLRLVGEASVSKLNCADLVQQFGSAMKTSISSIYKMPPRISSLAMIVGCALGSQIENIAQGVGVMLEVMATFGLIKVPLRRIPVVMQTIRVDLLDLNNLFSAVAIVSSLVSAGIAIAELVGMEQRIQPFHDAINSIQDNYPKFADGILQVPQRFQPATPEGLDQEE
ncbi:unnamed protein product [Aphanomyces euteiches]|uniref:Uncharacterized protein n=1 Tax=Aphanomyces euteiches TaxID=100861 RepID=A0A6G0W6F7_9STRA|nr:hypothetical protein Ae201684_018696 [Aphanomyces euteiches]KAH9088505.1 hypothetical protein Ae201684P_017115 [Aphanomyces euteiches]